MNVQMGDRSGLFHGQEGSKLNWQLKELAIDRQEVFALPSVIYNLQHCKKQLDSLITWKAGPGLCIVSYWRRIFPLLSASWLAVEILNIPEHLVSFCFHFINKTEVLLENLMRRGIAHPLRKYSWFPCGPLSIVDFLQLTSSDKENEL